MKRYSQYCPIAHALEAVGERWSLLIVRELLSGPRRYTDLADGLPGIGTNILASRLRELEQAGVVQKRKLPPPTPVSVYELTEYGWQLEEVMHSLARWGARSLGPPSTDERLAPGWSVNAVKATFRAEAAIGVHATYELRLGDDVTTMRIDDGSVAACAGPAEEPDLVLEADPATIFELVARTLTPADALGSGRARIEGTPEELERLVEMLSFEPQPAAARPTLV
jgi:DNA-binding HxlR family transcriptional regulator/putative sterol carrier protein